MVASSSSSSSLLLLIIVLALAAADLGLGSHKHHHHGHRHPRGSCHPSGHLIGKSGGSKCNRAHDSDCCVAARRYAQYKCSPPVQGGGTPAHMTVNSFAKGGDGGGRSECDGQYYPDHEEVVALSTGWYAGGSRCGKQVVVRANGRSVRAKVVDECDSVHGCDSEHDFQPPCPNDIVDASPAVWKALGIPDSVGYVSVTWTDA